MWNLYTLTTRSNSIGAALDAMPPLLMITLNSSSIVSPPSSYYSPATKPTTLLTSASVSSSSSSSSSSVAAAAARSIEQWTWRNGSLSARFQPCSWKRTGGMVMVAHLNPQAATQETVDGMEREPSKRNGGSGGRSNPFYPSAEQQNEVQDYRGPKSPTAGPGYKNPIRNNKVKEREDNAQTRGNEKDAPLSRWLAKTSKDVWKAPKKKVYGDQVHQEGRRFGSADVPAGLWKSYTNGIENLENDSPDSEGKPISWPERNEAMVAVQTATDIRATLLRVGRKLEISDANAVLRRFGRLGKWKESYVVMISPTLGQGMARFSLNITEGEWDLQVGEIDSGYCLESETVLFEWMKKQGKLSAPTYTSYFSLLGKAGQVEKALQEFKELKDEEILSNLFVWNSLLGTLIWNGKVDKAFHFFRLLKEQGLEPDRITYSTMISGCSKSMGGFYKAQELVKEMQNKGLKLNSVMYGALINVCANNHMVEEARARFDEMKAEGLVPNLFHFSSLLNAYALQGRHEEAENVIAEISNAGLKPNKVVYNSLINAYARAKLPLQAKQKFEEMRDDGLLPDMISYCSLMDAYGRVGQAEEAQAVFDEMKTVGVKPGSNSYSILIAAYGRSGNLTMIDKLRREIATKLGGDVDVHFFNALLKVYCQAGKMDRVMDILTKMDAELCSPNRITFHILIAYFCKEGLHDLTTSTLHDMEAKGYPANETSYTILIQGFLSRGRSDEVFDLLRQMQQRGIPPSRMIYEDMMSTFITLRMLNKVQEVFEIMKASNHVVSSTLLDTYLHLVAEEGKLELVDDVLQVMKRIDYNPGEELWDLLLLQADAQMQYRVLKKVLEEPGCRPTQNTIDILFEKIGGMKRPDLLQRLEAVHFRPHVA